MEGRARLGGALGDEAFREALLCRLSFELRNKLFRTVHSLSLIVQPAETYQYIVHGLLYAGVRLMELARRLRDELTQRVTVSYGTKRTIYQIRAHFLSFSCLAPQPGTRQARTEGHCCLLPLLRPVELGYGFSAKVNRCAAATQRCTFLKLLSSKELM